jgi:hypothetical protein
VSPNERLVASAGSQERGVEAVYHVLILGGR